MKLTLVVAVALVDADDRVLLAQRPEGKSLAGLWEFPGGKMEPGERPEDALIRELREELGIEVKAPCLAPLTFASHAYEDFHLLMPLLHLPAMGWLRAAARGAGAQMGEAEVAQGLPDAARRRAANPASGRSAGVRRVFVRRALTVMAGLVPATRFRRLCGDPNPQLLTFSPLAATSPPALASDSHMYAPCLVVP